MASMKFILKMIDLYYIRKKLWNFSSMRLNNKLARNEQKAKV